MGLVVVVTVPSPVAEEMIEAGDAVPSSSARDVEDIAPIVFTALGVVADGVSLVIAASAFGELWTRLRAFFRRTPTAEKLRIHVGERISFTADLDDLVSPGGQELNAIALRAIGEFLIQVADSSRQ
jgi:hypothetical protein